MDAPSPADLLLLVAVGLVAGAVNTVAGAGSLLLLPALMWTGLPADAANATNRIGILAQTVMAIVAFRREGVSPSPSELRMVAVVTAGGLAGAAVATQLSARSMELAIVAAMIVMLAVSVLPRPSTARAPGPVQLTPGIVLGLALIGVYGGFLQAGLGIMLVLFLDRATSMELVRANVLKSAATFALTLVALAVFSSAGETIDLARGGALAVGSAVGGLYGAKAAVRLGETTVRRVITAAIVLALVKMVVDLVSR